MIENMKFDVFIGSIINATCLLIVMKDLLRVKKLTIQKLLISIIILGVYIFVSYIITNSFIRMIILFIMIMMCGIYAFKNKKIVIQKIILYSFIEYVVLLLAEIIFSIVLMMVWQPLTTSNLSEVLGNFTINILIIFIFLVIMYIFAKLKSAFIKYNHIINFKSRELFMYFLLTVCAFCIIFYVSFRAENRILIFVVNFCSIIIYALIILRFIIAKSKNMKIQLEYEIAANNLTEYEILLNRQRLLNHENKNQLLVIKGMIEKGDNAFEYIDSILDNHYKDNEQLLMKTNLIPSGGLKGLIYYKMLSMKDENIDVTLSVNENISKINFKTLPIKTNQELCKIVGVFLDNAIQEVISLNEKHIDIIFEKENNDILIIISNNYGQKSFEHFGEEGYTTKGKGHGYGLKLVEKILNENKNFKHETRINGNVFSQIVRLKIIK